MDPFHRSAVLLLVALGAVVGCSPSVPDSRAAYVRPADTAVPQGTADPRAQPAIEAYDSFVAAVHAVQRTPVPSGTPYPGDADLNQHSFDPARAQYQALVAGLAAEHLEYRGTPPTSRVTVSLIDVDATPWPRVVLADCRVGTDGWTAYDTRTGTARPDQVPGLPTPDGLAVTMIRDQQHWGVQTVLPAPAGTCSGD